MQLIKRFFFFILTNIAILALLSIVLAVLGHFFPELNTMAGGYLRILIIAAVVGFAGSFLSLWISRWMAKKTYSIQLLTAETAMSDKKLSVVWNTVERIAREHNIKMPEVGYFESQDPNAFATGATKNSSLVAVSTGLLNTMEINEVEGVVGHEMAHILNGDMVTLTLIQGVMNTFVIFLSHVAARIVSNILTRGEDDNTIGYFTYNLIYIGFQIGFGFLASLVVMWFSRMREYRADLGGAKYTSKSSMIAGLKRLQSMKDLKTTPVDGKMSAFMITSPDSMFSTHPSLDNRIKALEENYQLA